MNGLALCAGIGGIELGLKLAIPSFRTVCFVEREAYAAACLVKRMAEGFLDKAPIWDDVRTFDAEAWRGVVDIVTAGYPCQPFSVAARGRTTAENIWYAIAKVIRACSPPIVFLENVTAHLSNGVSLVRDDLRAMDYCVLPPLVTSAAAVGAPHRRPRMFLLAYTYGESKLVRSMHEEASWIQEIAGPWNGWPDIQGMDDGVPNRVERNRVLGNAVVPLVAAKAFSSLTGRLN